MKISGITYDVVTIPLSTTFKTALRTVDSMENVIVIVHTDTDFIGYGSAAPATVITGETIASICGGIDHLREQLSGMDILLYEVLFQKLNKCILGCLSAKAAVDMAVHDLLARFYGVPLYQLLGGPVRTIKTDITISLDEPKRMVAKSQQRVTEGFSTLKIKVGGDPDVDISRIEHIRQSVGDGVNLRIDANQGWSPKAAVYVGRELEKRNIRIELMEQPVPAHDFEGLRFVREHLTVPVYADESAFSPQDVLRLIGMGAVDGINIKLMKCGGIYNAMKIAAIAESANIPCMVGSMMENHISVTAAAHLAAGKQIISGFDLDSPLFCSVNPAVGGISYRGSKVELSELPGLGITSLNDLKQGSLKVLNR